MIDIDSLAVCRALSVRSSKKLKGIQKTSKVTQLQLPHARVSNKVIFQVLADEFYWHKYKSTLLHPICTCKYITYHASRLPPYSKVQLFDICYIK
jgi:hypothetical protein